MVNKNPPTPSPENYGIEKKKKESSFIDFDSLSLLEIHFPADKMPKIFNTLIIKEQNSFEDYTYVICEVQRILKYNRVLAVAALSRGYLKNEIKVLDTGVLLSAIRGREERFEGFTMYIEKVTNLNSVSYAKDVTPMARRVTVVLLLARLFIKLFGGLR